MSVIRPDAIVVAQSYVAARQSYRPQPGVFGLDVAHQELNWALLRDDAVEALHFFQSFADSSANRPSSDERLFEMRSCFGADRVRTHAYDDLGSLAATVPYVYFGAGFPSPQIAQLRALAPARFPICSLVHSLSIGNTRGLGALALVNAFAIDGDAVVATSRAGEQTVRLLLSLGEECLGRLGAGISRRTAPDVHYIPLGVDVDAFGSLDKSWCRRVLRIPDSATVVLYVGRFSDEYKADLEPLLVAFGRASKACMRARQKGSQASDIILMLAGPRGSSEYVGHLEGLLRSRGDALGGDRVRFVTDFADYAKGLIYGAADVFVSPVDNIQETFGLSILEAMASGLPVIASDWSGYRDLVVHGETGLLIPTYWNRAAAERLTRILPVYASTFPEYYLAQHTVTDVDALTHALSTAIADPSLRQRFGAAGRQRVVDRFSLTRVVSALIELWRAQRATVAASAGGDRRDRRHPAQLDLNRLFSHYASASIDPRSALELTEEGRSALTQGFAAARMPPGLGKAQALAVLRVLASDPHAPGGPSEHQGLDGARRDVERYLTWLRKKGYVRPSNGSANEPS